MYLKEFTAMRNNQFNCPVDVKPVVDAINDFIVDEE